MDVLAQDPLIAALSLANWSHVAAALLPVCGYLGMLVVLDSYKLVRVRSVALALGAGILAAVVTYFVQTELLAILGIGFETFSRYVAPLVEESAKTAYLFFLIRTSRVGFLVDGAVLGFAVGTGFALAENLYYLSIHPDPALATWILRGLGTAVMHGSTTCLFAIVTKSLHDRSGGSVYMAAAPALAAVYAAHSLFNHFLLPPLATAALLLTAFPALVVVVFARSERATSRWLTDGFDSDQSLLDMITFGDISNERLGGYLKNLRTHFKPEIVADMLCLVRLQAELSLKAKGLLMMREAGFNVAPGADVQALLEEVAYLRRSIGPTGLRALAPFLSTGALDRWQVRMLETG